MPHTIDLDEMLAFIDDKRRASITFASSSREYKKIDIAIAGGYQVWHGNKVVWEGTDGRTAVEKYNAISAKPEPNS